jgi:hypothetical protein
VILARRLQPGDRYVRSDGAVVKVVFVRRHLGGRVFVRTDHGDQLMPGGRQVQLAPPEEPMPS